MKNLSILSILVIILAFASCKDNKKETEEKATTIENSGNHTDGQLYACSMHPEVTGKKGEACSKCGMELTEPVKQAEVSDQKTETIAATTNPSSFSINEIVTNYLKLKNALVKDDSKEAANAGKALYTTFTSVNTKVIDPKLQKEYIDISDDAKEHAEHIGDNGGKIEHQREHFAMLSKDINDLIKTFGTNQKLYYDYCPMYDNGKTGYWISETKEIKNPFYGAKMLTCGSIKKQIN